MRLKVMAAERAPTMATMIQASFTAALRASRLDSRTANKAPVKANGKANTECSNLIISSVSLSLCSIARPRLPIPL